MELRSKRSSKLIITVLMLSLFVLFTGDPSIAKIVSEESDVNYPSSSNYRNTEMGKILSFLENRVGSPIVSEQVKDKVFKLDDKRIRLIASLAELITDDRQTAGAEIGFLVITVLIIVS